MPAAKQKNYRKKNMSSFSTNKDKNAQTALNPSTEMDPAFDFIKDPNQNVSKKRRASALGSAKKTALTGLATLSIKQPAAALILYRGKDVENRSKSKFKGGGNEFDVQSRWVLIQTGQTRQKPEPILSTPQLNAASIFQNKEFEDTTDVMNGVDQTTGSIVGAMLVSEQRPSTLACDSVWASDNEVHIMIEKTIAFTQPQKYKGALCLFPIPWKTLNKSIQHELSDIKDQFIMRNINDTNKKTKI